MPLSRDIQSILDLLRDYTTLPRVQRFLAGRDLPRTAASWKELTDERLAPALEKGSVTRDDLINLLRESEEHGQQHVFLYRTTKAAQLLDVGRIRRELRRVGSDDVLALPKVLNRPPSATIVDGRAEKTATGEDAFTLKAIETRVYQKRKSQRTTSHQIIIEFEPIETRAVNVIRLRSSGLLEMRIQSYTNTTQYDDAVKEMWDFLGTIFPRDSFLEVPLVKAKDDLLAKEEQLKEEVRFSDSTMKNEAGIMMRIATGDADASLFEDRNAARSITGFRGSSTYCERLNVYFLHQKNVPLPTRDTHVLIGGRLNEYAIPGACVKEDYEHVLERLLHHNR